jgi:hypothetical protein
MGWKTWKCSKCTRSTSETSSSKNIYFRFFNGLYFQAHGAAAKGEYKGGVVGAAGGQSLFEANRNY